MALLINQAAPAGSDSPTLGDDQIRAFKLAVEDIFGIPDNAVISQAVMDVDAGGLAQVIFYDPAATPASGELGRSGSTLYYRITDARTATTTRAFGVIADTTGSPAASIGVGMLFQAESADESPSDFGALDFAASDVGAGTEDTFLDVALRVAGAALAYCYRFVATAAFRAIFTHANTADRTYTLPNDSGTFDLLGTAQTITATKTYKQAYSAGYAIGSASLSGLTPNMANGNVQSVTATASGVMVTPTNAAFGMTLILQITQDATGGRVMTWPSTFHFPGGTEGVLSTAAGAIDVLSGVYNGTNWLVALSKDHKA